MSAPVFTLLWSGDVRGARKVFIPAIEAGLCGAWRDGKPWKPDSEALRAALPVRHPNAFDRTGRTVWFDDAGVGIVRLNSQRGEPIATYYLVLKTTES